MAPNTLAALLAPYQAALAGEEMNTSDPIYQLLNPPATTKERVGAAVGAAGMAGAKSLSAIADRYGWDEGKQWDALLELMDRESDGNRLAQNPTSTAFGRWQFLDSTWDDVGGHKTKNRRLQDIYGLRYIDQRYGSPLDALLFHNKNNYY